MQPRLWRSNTFNKQTIGLDTGTARHRRPSVLEGSRNKDHRATKSGCGHMLQYWRSSTAKMPVWYSGNMAGQSVGSV